MKPRLGKSCPSHMDKAQELIEVAALSELLSHLLIQFTVKPVYNDHSQKDRKLVFKTNYHLN